MHQHAVATLLELIVVHPLLEAGLVLVAGRRRSSDEVTAPSIRPRRLVGAPTRVTGLAVVEPGSTALLLHVGGRVELLGPGGIVGPALRPAAAPTVLVLNHHAVRLDLVLGPLTTLDARTLETVVLRLEVRLVDPPSGVLELARTHGDSLEQAMLDQLSHEVSDQVVAAVRMNRVSDLERLSVSGVLEDGWLGTSFLGDLLVRDDLHVTDVGWPTQIVADPAASRRGRP